MVTDMSCLLGMVGMKGSLAMGQRDNERLTSEEVKTMGIEDCGGVVL